MTNKKRYIIVLVLLLFIGLGIFTFAAPSEEDELSGNNVTSGENVAIDNNATTDNKTTDEDEDTTLNIRNIIQNNNPQNDNNNNEKEKFNIQNNNVQSDNNNKEKETKNDDNIVATDDDYDKALAAVIKAEMNLDEESYETAMGLVDLVDQTHPNKEDLESRLSEVNNEIVTKLVNQLKSLTQAATDNEDKEELADARKFRKDSEIVAKVEALDNDLEETLESILTNLSRILDDTKGPEFNIKDGALLNSITAIEVKDAEENEIISLILVDEEGNEVEFTEDLEVKDGTYTLMATDAALNDSEVTFILDTKTAQVESLRILAHNSVVGEKNVRYVNDGDRVLVYLTLDEKAFDVTATINGIAMEVFSDKYDAETGKHAFTFEYYLKENDGLEDGMATFKITGEDRAGNSFAYTEEDVTTPGQKWIYIDRTPVKVTDLRFTVLNGKGPGEKPEYKWFAFDNSTIMVYLNTDEELAIVPTAKINGQEITLSFYRIAEDGTYFYGGGYKLQTNDGLADGLVDIEVTNIQDFAGNNITLTNADNTLSSQRNVYIDRNAPVVTLNGDKNVYLEAGIDTYVEEYATVTDAVDGIKENLTYKEVKWYKYDENAGGDHYVYQGIVNEVNTNVPGRYNVIYWTYDEAGHMSAKVTRLVFVEDTTPATITIPFTAGLNKNEMIVNSGDVVTIEDVMATVTDNVDEIVKIKPIRADLLISNKPEENTYNYDFSNGFDTNYAGRYNLYYEYEDAAGNISTAGMMIVMKDKVYPTVRFTKLNKYLKVDEITPVEYNGKLYFSEPVTVSFGDNVNIKTLGHNDWEKVEANIKRTGWAENATALGEHTVYVIDSSGNKTSVTFTIVENPELIVQNGVMNITDDSLIINDSIYYDETGDGTMGNIINASGDVVINGNNKTVTMGTTYPAPYLEQWSTGYKAPAMTNIFASKNGSFVVNDLTISGQMASNTIGWYATPTGKNILNNVNIINTEVVSFSEIAAGLIVYGEAELNNTNVYGTKMSNMDISGSPLYDLAVVNDTKTTINGGKYGSIYTWWKLDLTIKNAVVDTIYSNTDTRKEGVVIDEGTTVGNLIVSSYYNANKDTYNTPKVTIKAGAVVEVLDLSNAECDDYVIIEDGAVVKTIIN